MPRILVLGCGTGVGKTRLSVALLRELQRVGQAACIGLKPIETGVAPVGGSAQAGSDAHALVAASSLQTAAVHPLYALEKPISPHLAARAIGAPIEIPATAQWVRQIESEVTPLVASDMVLWRIIETAGGAFSPLAPGATNFDLAKALDPAIWVLVASDSLGVLHEVTATLLAMRARQRTPDHVVLSAAREPDASTGSNAKELQALGIVRPSAVLGRDDDAGIRDLVQSLLLAPLVSS